MPGTCRNRWHCCTRILADYFSFMDFEGVRIGGGAGSLVNIVKAFAGAEC